MFKLSELVRWFGLTEFEIFTNLVSFLIFSILLSIKLEGQLLDHYDWYQVFSPLFCSDICNGYFCIIVGIRMYRDCDQIKRKAFSRLVWSAKFIVLTAVFKYLLCLKLSGMSNLDFSEVFSPIFVLLQLIGVRGCQLSNTA